MANKIFYIQLVGSDGVDYTQYIAAMPDFSFYAIDPASREINNNFTINIKFVRKAMDDDEIDIPTFLDLDHFWIYIKNTEGSDQQTRKIVKKDVRYSAQFKHNDIMDISFVSSYWAVKDEATILENMKTPFQEFYMPIWYKDGNVSISPQKRSFAKYFSSTRRNNIGVIESGGPLLPADRAEKISYLNFSYFATYSQSKKIINSYGGKIYHSTPLLGDNIEEVIPNNDNTTLGEATRYLNEDYMDYIYAGKNSQDNKGFLVTTPILEGRDWEDYSSVQPGRVIPLSSISDIGDIVGESGVDTANPYIYPWSLFSPIKMKSQRIYVGFCDKDSNWVEGSADDKYGYFRNAQVIGPYIPESDHTRYLDQEAKRTEVSGLADRRIYRSRHLTSLAFTDIVNKKYESGVRYWDFNVEYAADPVSGEEVYSQDSWTDVNNFRNYGAAYGVHIPHASEVSASYNEINTLGPDDDGAEVPVQVYRIPRKRGYKEVVNDSGAYDRFNSEPGPNNPKEYYYVGDLPLTLEPGYYSFVAEGPELKFNHIQYPKSVDASETEWSTPWTGQLDRIVNRVKPFILTIVPTEIVPVYQKIINAGRKEYLLEDVAATDGRVLALTEPNIAVSYWRDLTLPYFQHPALYYGSVGIQQYDVDDGSTELEPTDMQFLFDQERMVATPGIIRDPHIYYHSDGYIYLAYILVEDPQHANSDTPYYGGYDRWTFPSGVSDEIHQVIIKRLTWNSTLEKWEWDTNHNRYFVAGDIKPHGTRYGDEPNDSTVASLINHKYTYSITGMSETADGNLLLGINSSRIISKEIPVSITKVGWYNTDRESDDGESYIRNGYIKCIGDVSNHVSTGDEVYLYVPFYIRAVSPDDANLSYPVKSKVISVDHVEDDNSTYISIDPPPNTHGVSSEDIATLQDRNQYWDSDEQKETSDTSYWSEPKLFRALPKSDPRAELWVINRNQFKNEDQGWYGQIDIDQTIIPTEEEEYTLSTSWDAERRGYTAELPTGRVVWDDSPDYSITSSTGLPIVGSLSQDDEGKWYIRTQELAKDIIVTVDVYPEGTLQPIGEMRDNSGGSSLYPSVYRNGYFYRVKKEDDEYTLDYLFTDHHEKITNAQQIIADPIENGRGNFFGEMRKNFYAQVGDRPRNIAGTWFPILPPEKDFDYGSPLVFLQRFNQIGYLPDYLNINNEFHNIINIVSGEPVIVEANVLDFRETLSTSTPGDFRVQWGEDNYYPESAATSTTASIDTLQLDAVNKWDAISAYLYERIVRRNEYPLVELTISLESWDDIREWQDFVGKLVSFSGMEEYLEQGDIAKLLLLGFKPNVTQKILTAHFLHLPEEI